MIVTITVYHYPKCTTCKKAIAWLKEEDIAFDTKDLVTETPTAEEIKEMQEKSGLSLKKFFNTSGMKYRELELKDRLAEMSESEQLKLLASDGMLIKRPITYDGERVTVGFNENKFIENWKK